MISKNIREDIESNKLDSKRETTLNIESSNLESKYKDNTKLDSNGDEIVYEVRHNPNWWDYFLMSVFFIFSVGMVYKGTENFLLNEIDITILLFGIPALLLSFYYLFYAHKNRFYITTQGIGFERRKWLRMQRGFYRFGEVGVVETSTTLGLYPANPPRFISIFPLGAIKSKFFFVWQLKPYCVIPLMAWNTYLSPKIYNKAIDAYHLHDFLIKKTKEALRAKGIDTKTLCFDLDKQFKL